MANEVYGQRPFGIAQIVLTSLGTSPTSVELAVEQTLTFTERVKEAELEGRGKVASVASVCMALDWDLEEGGIPLAAYALMTGRTSTTSGSTPNRTSHLVGDSSVYNPYFKITGRAFGEDATDDVKVIIYKAKLKTGISGSFKDGAFFVTKCSGVAVDDGTNGVWDLLFRETGASISPA
jgi:hypothetical protein